MKNRNQKLPPCFWGTHAQNDKRTMVYYSNDVEHITSSTRLTTRTIIGDDSDEAKAKGFEAVARAQEKGFMAIEFAFNPVTGQSEVVSFAEVGVYAEMVYKPNIIAAIEKAKREVFSNGIPQIQIIREKSKKDIGYLKRTPASGVLTEEEMAEAQKRVDAMKLVTK